MFSIQYPDYAPPSGEISLRGPNNTITDLVIHHSDGPINQTALDIDKEHRSASPPYAMIAYEWVIGGDGTIWAGRPLKYVSAASFGRNPMSVAICLTGQFEPTAGNYSPPTAIQIEALKWLALYVHKTTPTIERTYAHGDISGMFYPTNTGDYATACCGATLRAQIPDIKSYVAENMRKL